MDTGNVERTKNPRTWRDRAAIPQDSGDGVTYRKAPRGAVTYKSPFKDKPFKKNNKSTLFIGSKFSMDNAVPPARSVATPVSSEPTFPKGKGTAAQPTRMKYKRLSTDYIKNLMTNVFWMGKGTPR
jgi:hypothetical protein